MRPCISHLAQRAPVVAHLIPTAAFVFDISCLSSLLNLLQQVTYLATYSKALSLITSATVPKNVARTICL